MTAGEIHLVHGDGLRALLAALPFACWVNWPPALHAAEHKPHQLVQVAKAGLRIPQTMITNDPDSATGFARQAEPVLYKSLRGQPAVIDGQRRYVYATEVTAQQCRSEAVRVAPILLQHRVSSAF